MSLVPAIRIYFFSWPCYTMAAKRFLFTDIAEAVTSAGNFTFEIQYTGEVLKNTTATSPKDCYNQCSAFTSEELPVTPFSILLSFLIINHKR
jgi:hypothetical protein